MPQLPQTTRSRSGRVPRAAAPRPRSLAVMAALVAAIAPASAEAATGGGAQAGALTASSSAGSAAERVAARAAHRRMVAAAQRRLHVTADGIWGPRTRAAIRRFQRRRGLRADARLSGRTLAALGVAPVATAATRRPTRGAGAVLEAIAQCESGGDPTRLSAGGTYRGKYQFRPGTWHLLGGTGDPARASEAEQDRRAAALFAKQGIKPWPACGRRAMAAA